VKRAFLRNPCATVANARRTRGVPILVTEKGPFIGQRSSPYHLAGNRNAAHPVNAILNYACAALESEIRIKAISDGYDPTIGIMHDGSDGSSKFIFDLMEPERPKIDRAVLDFVKGRVFDPADFVIRADGVCRLNPEMARVVVAKVST
jgi:CRISPR-associated protein Cas1